MISEPQTRESNTAGTPPTSIEQQPVDPVVARQSPAMIVGSLIGGAAVAGALYVAASLRIADRLAAGPQWPDQLANASKAHPPSLARVLRALASIGVFAQDAEGRFRNTPLSNTLRSDVPGSLRPNAVTMALWTNWSSLLHGVRTGEIPFRHAYGVDVYEFLAARPALAADFDASMSAFSAVEADAVIAAYDFSGATTILDAGGSLGFFLEAVLRAHPGKRGVLFDRQPVIERAREALACSDVRDRIDLIGGSFADGVPAGADVCVLKHVLHDFDDEQASAVLRGCRSALPAHGRIAILEDPLPSGNTPSPGKLLDLTMLFVGGRERSAEEYAALLEMSGFRLERIIPTPSLVHIIEGSVV